MFTDGEVPVPDHPDLNVVTNIGRSRPPRSVFHCDTSYVARPPSFSALFAVEVPEQGGATLFMDQYAAFASLQADLHRDLIGAKLLHGPRDVPETDAIWHPVVRRNPVTDCPALFLTALARCHRLVLADGSDRTDLLPTLYEHSIHQQAPRRHLWRAGDVVIWDNRCTLHAADYSDVFGNRTPYRGMVQGEVPEMARLAG